MVNSKSVVGIKPGYSGVVIEYQVHIFTCTRLVEHIIAQSHIYPGFTCKVSTLIHFPLEPGSFWMSTLKTEQGLDSVLTDSIDTPELDASFDEADAMPSSVPSGFLCSVNTVSDNCRLQLVPASHLVNFGARLGLYFCLHHRQVKCQPLSWCITFPFIHQHLESGVLCHLILSLYPASKKIDQSRLSEWHWCSCSCPLDTEQIFSCTRVAIADIIVSLQGSGGGVNAALEVHEVLTGSWHSEQCCI